MGVVREFRRGGEPRRERLLSEKIKKEISRFVFFHGTCLFVGFAQGFLGGCAPTRDLRGTTPS